MLGNWVRETTTSTGAGALTLASVSGYPTFNTLFGLSQYFRYAILDEATGAPIEMGIGHLTSSTTLSRDIVLAKVDGGTYSEPNSVTGQVNLAAGTKRVICTADQSALMTNPIGPPIRNNATANNRIVIPDNIIAIASGSLSITAGRLYAWPVLIPHRGPYDAFVFRASATGADVDIGLYAMTPDGLPGALIQGVNAVASAGGANFATFTARDFAPGWYCMALNASSGTPTYNLGTIREGYGRTDPHTQAPLLFRTISAGTLPDPFGTPSVIGNLANVPGCGLRLA